MYSVSANDNGFPSTEVIYLGCSLIGCQLRKWIGGAPSIRRMTFPERFRVYVTDVFAPYASCSAGLSPVIGTPLSPLEISFRFSGGIGGLWVIVWLCRNVRRNLPTHLKYDIFSTKQVRGGGGEGERLRDQSYLITWTTTMKNQRPVSPHICLADNSMNTSQYSRVVSRIFNRCSLGVCVANEHCARSIIRSLNNTNRLDSE